MICEKLLQAEIYAPKQHKAHAKYDMTTKLNSILIKTTSRIIIMTQNFHTNVLARYHSINRQISN